MKNKFFVLLMVMMMTNGVFAQGYLDYTVPKTFFGPGYYQPGTIWKSPNGRFQLEMCKNGYLEESAITHYGGRIVIWQAGTGHAGDVFAYTAEGALAHSWLGADNTLETRLRVGNIDFHNSPNKPGYFYIDDEGNMALWIFFMNGTGAYAWKQQNAECLKTLNQDAQPYFTVQTKIFPGNYPVGKSWSLGNNWGSLTLSSSGHLLRTGTGPTILSENSRTERGKDYFIKMLNKNSGMSINPDGSLTVTNAITVYYDYLTRDDKPELNASFEKISDLNTISKYEYNAGNIVFSKNDKYVLELTTTGYLVESEITKYGKFKIWQFPEEGKGVSSSSFYFSPENNFFGIVKKDTKSDNVYKVNTLYEIKNGDGEMRFEMQDDGNMVLIATNGDKDGTILWSSHSGKSELNAKGLYVPYVSVGNNLFFPQSFNDERCDLFFAMGKIKIGDNCKIQQKINPIAFRAKGFIELVPGFQSDVSGTGSILFKPLVVSPTVAIKSKKSKNKATAKQLEQLQMDTESRFTLFPNPTTGTVNIAIDSGDAIKNTLLYDITGKLLSQYPKTTSFSIEDKPSGIYLYSIETEKKTYTGKIIKQ